MPGRLEGKSAVITGGASGIGAATARVFVEEGARVLLADVSVEEGEKVAEELRDDGYEARFLETDVSSSPDVQSMIQTAVDEYGSLDVLFNNAGIEGQVTDTVNYDESSFDQVIAVNMKGVWLGLKYGARQMLQQEGGSIISTASIGGVVGLSNYSPYCGTKGAVIQMTKTVALEYAEQGIRANAIAPGVVKTAMIERAMAADPETAEEMEQMEPMQGMTDPYEVGRAAAFLGSEDASRITGVTLPVDGGFLAT